MTSGEPWAPEFTRSVFRANFAEDCEIGKPRVIQNRLNALMQSGSYLGEDDILRFNDHYGRAGA